jgi:hypothetical protein
MRQQEMKGAGLRIKAVDIPARQQLWSASMKIARILVVGRRMGKAA